MHKTKFIFRTNVHGWVSALFQIGDRILAVNGQDVRNASQELAISLIKSAGSSIQLEIQSFDLNVIARFIQIDCCFI